MREKPSAIAAASDKALVLKQAGADAKVQADAVAEQVAQQVRNKARSDREREFLTAKARDYADFAALAAFAKFMSDQAQRDGSEPVDRLAKELQTLVDDRAGASTARR